MNKLQIAGHDVIVSEVMPDNLLALLPPPRLVAVRTDKETGKKVYTWEFKPGVLFVNGFLQQRD